MVTYTCNPSYCGGKRLRRSQFKANLEKNVMRPISTNKLGMVA
jgi:hypothetical protein